MSIGNNTDEELYVSDDIEATWRDFGKIPQPSKNLVETTSQKIPQTETEIIWKVTPKLSTLKLRNCGQGQIVKREGGGDIKIETN